MTCKKCKVTLNKIKEKISEDFIGGLLLIIGAGFYGLNIYEAYTVGNIEGVSWAWASFFCILNAAYCRIFWNNRLFWSFLGSFVLFLAEAVYFGQILYYS